jgi:transcriptional antiterminator RfaH
MTNYHAIKQNNSVPSSIIQTGFKIMHQQYWHAVYTRPRHEKKVLSQLQQEKIEAYLPLQTTIRQWSDRKKKVSEPLFSCYVFVKINAKEYYTILNKSGVVRYVSFEGKAATIPEKQIQLIKNILAQDLKISDINEHISPGTKVEIIAGPLMGVIGELINYAGKSRVIIRIEEIEKSIIVNVPLHFLRQIFY